MKMQVLPLSHVDGYIAKPIQKIYSTKCIGLSGRRPVETIDYNNDNTSALSKHGEIALTKACDESLICQALKLGCNMVLGAGYSLAISDVTIGNEWGSYSEPAFTMYAYGEAVKLEPVKRN